MNTEIQAQWVAALRSGEYRQGKSQLRGADDTFCCLGVLCDLAVKAGVEINVHAPDDEYGSGNDSYRYGNSESYLPVAVREWAGIEHEDPIIGTATRSYQDRTAGRTAATYNDGGKTFAEIADLIEQGVR